MSNTLIGRLIYTERLDGVRCRIIVEPVAPQSMPPGFDPMTQTLIRFDPQAPRDGERLEDVEKRDVLDRRRRGDRQGIFFGLIDLGPAEPKPR